MPVPTPATRILPAALFYLACAFAHLHRYFPDLTLTRPEGAADMRGIARCV